MTHKPCALRVRSVLYLAAGVLLGSLLSLLIHTVTITCITCTSNNIQLVTSRIRADRLRPEREEEADCLRVRTQLKQWDQLEDVIARLKPPADPNRPSTRDSIEEYINPTNPVGSQERVEVGSVATLAEEYRVRKMLYVGVMTAQDYLSTRAVAVYATWGIEVTKIAFYVGEDCEVPKPLSVLPIERLYGVPDNVYPPQRKVFQMLKHMHDHYIDEFDWFMRADDDVYMRGREIEQLLSQLNPAEKIFLGRSGAGKPEDMARLKLLPHERYCMGGPGVVFSNAALRALVPHLDECLEAIEYYNKFAESSWYNEDVELGRCVSRKVGIQCSTSLEIRSYLLYDYDKLALDPKTLWAHQAFRSAISIHPAKDPNNMQAIHHFYKTIDMQNLQNKVKLAQTLAVQSCLQLPEELRYNNPKCAPPLSKCHALPEPSCTPIPSSQLPHPYVSRELDELPVWMNFDFRYIHQLDVNTPRKMLGGEFAEDVEAVTRQAVNILSKRGLDWNFEKIVNGFLRYDSLKRREYILDIMFSTYNSTRLNTKRVSIIQPLSTDYVTHLPSNNEKGRVFLTTCLYNVQDRFENFMIKYENTVLQIKDNLNLLHLWLIVFGEEDVRHVQNTVDQYLLKYPTALVTVLKGEGQFARGLAIDQAISKLPDDSLIFICDVDLDIHPEFFTRCARNTLQGQRVYYPMFFKLYNMQYVYGSEEVTTATIEMIREQGHWASYSYGMLCIYKSDYDASGGFDRDISGWGGEDVDLYSKVIKAGYDVLRVPDPGLIHRWHPKHCGNNLDKEQYVDCMYSKAENFADRRELSEHVIEIERQAKSHDLTFNPDTLFE